MLVDVELVLGLGFWLRFWYDTVSERVESWERSGFLSVGSILPLDLGLRCWVPCGVFVFVSSTR